MNASAVHSLHLRGATGPRDSLLGMTRMNDAEGGGTRQLGLVGARGFEPPTPASRTRCATGLRYAPIHRTSLLPFTSVARIACRAPRPRPCTSPVRLSRGGP